MSDTESIPHFGKNTRKIKLASPIDIAFDSYIIKYGKLKNILIESGGGTRPSEARQPLYVEYVWKVPNPTDFYLKDEERQ